MGREDCSSEEEDSSATEQLEKNREICLPDSKADTKVLLSKPSLPATVTEQVRAQISCTLGIILAFAEMPFDLPYR